MLHVVRVRHWQPTEGNLRPKNPGTLTAEGGVVSLCHGGAKFVAHGNVLRIVVMVMLKRGHATNTLEVPLKVHGHECAVSTVAES